MSRKICLDAGHYGKYNQSPANKDYYESDMNWLLHLLLKRSLEEYGLEVVLTRENQATDKGLTARGRESKGCDLFLSIHSNAVGSGVNENVDYPIVYVPLNGSGDEIGKKLADCICSVMETKQKGRVDSRKGNNGDYYGVIRGAVSVGTPGLILEHSFHTNTRIAKWLMGYDNLDKLARAEAKVIAEHFGMVKQTPNDDGWYRVRKSWNDAGSQVGAFRILKYAVDACPAGYKVFDSSGFVVHERVAEFVPYLVEITASVLNVRDGAGTSYKINTTVKSGDVYTIVAEKNGWGKLKSGAGWISLKYCSRL